MSASQAGTNANRPASAADQRRHAPRREHDPHERDHPPDNSDRQHDFPPFGCSRQRHTSGNSAATSATYSTRRADAAAAQKCRPLPGAREDQQ